MKKCAFEINDGRFLCMKAFEITSFPSFLLYGKSPNESNVKIFKEFSQLVTEGHKLSGSNTCLEFLWITEKVENQMFSSKIHIFSILRKIGKNEEQITNDLNNLQKNLIDSLSSLQFSIKEVDIANSILSSLISNIDDSSICGIVKKEKCIANASSVYPYYFTEVVPNDNYMNFNSIISVLSQHENCCISFQIFPIKLTNEELQMINEVTAELDRVVAGTMVGQQFYKDSLAKEPLSVFSYYNERRNSPMFMYNILAIGNGDCCSQLATKITSLLQGGESKIVVSDFMCINLSNEKIKLKGQFPYYVWNVNNSLMYNYRNSKLQKFIPLAKSLFRLPYIMSVEEVVSFYRLPLYEKMMSSLKSNQTINAQEQFSNSVVNRESIQIGTLVSNDSVNIKIGCPESSFTKHALIVGTPGSGKTTFSINLLLQFAKKKIPFLAIEPTKTEYRAMIDTIPDLQIFTPGNNSVSPFIINPFIPPRGINIEQYIPSLASAFKAAFSMPSPLDMIFLKAIRTCYIQYGWKDYSKIGDEDVTLFGLYEFILVFKDLMGNTNYSKEVQGNIESAGLLRLTNLIEQNSNIYDTINTVAIEDLLTSPSVLELNSIDNAEQKSLIMALLLINICIYTKHNQIGDGKLKNVILIDEAHVLLGGNSTLNSEGNTNTQATTIKALQDMIAEIRSYGTSIIIADQSPTKVSREVVANTDIKVSFRLVQSVEKELISDSTNMDEDSQNNLSRLKPGEAYVYFSKLETPQMVMTEDIREKERIRLNVTDLEVAERTMYWKTHFSLLKPYRECSFNSFCKDTCDFVLRANAEFIANSAFYKYRSAIKDVGSLKKCVFHLPNLMIKEYEKYPNSEIKRVQICSRIKLMRKSTLELPFSIASEEKKILITSFPKKRIENVHRKEDECE